MKIDRIKTGLKLGNRKEVPQFKNNPPAVKRYPEHIRQSIEKKAYELYEQRGLSHGSDWNDWFEAEKSVISGLNTANV